MKEFRALKSTDEQAFLDYIAEWKTHKETIVPSATNYYQYKDFKTFFNQLKNHLNQEIPNTTYFLFVDGMIVGASNIRHRLNSHLHNRGGHIGYGVRKSARGQGYATEILRYSLEYLESINVHRALMTCDEDNIASSSVIIKNGGIEDVSYIQDNGVKTRRFWIEID